jgi:hypothetical protein
MRLSVSALLFCVTVLPSCHTSGHSDAASRLDAGTTVDNGRRGPIAIMIQYASSGTGIDQDAKRAIDGLIADDRAVGNVDLAIESVWGGAGETTDCAKFKSIDALQDFRNRVCAVIADRQAITGSTTVTEQLKLDCGSADDLGPIQGEPDNCQMP